MVGFVPFSVRIRSLHNSQFPRVFHASSAPNRSETPSRIPVQTNCIPTFHRNPRGSRLSQAGNARRSLVFLAVSRENRGFVAPRGTLVAQSSPRGNRLAETPGFHVSLQVAGVRRGKPKNRPILGSETPPSGVFFASRGERNARAGERSRASRAAADRRGPSEAREAAGDRGQRVDGVFARLASTQTGIGRSAPPRGSHKLQSVLFLESSAMCAV